MIVRRYLLGTVWVGILAALVAMTQMMQQSTEHFPGLAKATQKKINYNFPVTVVSMHAQKGKHVDRGELLMQVRRIDMQDKLRSISEKIDRIITEHRVVRENIRARIAQLRIRKLEELTPLQSRLQELRDLLRRNLALLKNIDPSIKIDNNTPQKQLRTIEKKIRLIEERYALQKKQLQNEIEARDKPVVSQLWHLYNERKAIYRMLKAQPVYAPWSGIVDEINYHAGNDAPAFSPLLSIQSDRPTFVEAYIPEDRPNHLKIGDRVSVTPRNSDPTPEPVIGKVVDLGSRIVPLPAHLKRFSSMMIWGYKVTIALPPNSFKIDQRVTVSGLKAHEKASIRQRLPKQFSQWIENVCH